jgi:hypothetical protein
MAHRAEHFINAGTIISSSILMPSYRTGGTQHPLPSAPVGAWFIIIMLPVKP